VIQRIIKIDRSPTNLPAPKTLERHDLPQSALPKGVGGFGGVIQRIIKVDRSPANLPAPMTLERRSALPED